MARKMFFLCFTLMEASGCSPCNIAHLTKALIFHLDFDPPNIKLCLPRSLNLLVFISRPTGFFGEKVKKPCSWQTPCLSVLPGWVGNLNQKCKVFPVKYKLVPFNLEVFKVNSSLSL